MDFNLIALVVLLGTATVGFAIFVMWAKRQRD